jgi:phage terminase large subunit
MTEPPDADFDLVDQPEAVLQPAIIPYVPRPHFRPLHASQKRWIFVVAHRRAGKTVALVNQLIRAALSNPRRHPPPRYAYVGPSFDQVKDLCWGYLKHYAGGYPGIRFLEGELTVIFPHGATIRLYGGGQAYERIRGIYLDGAVLDEYPLLNPRAWTSVVRPTLADYRGFVVISGTSNGDDHFHAVKLKAEDDAAWDVFDIKITDTGEYALKYEEQKELTRDMPADEYAREMLNAFDAPVEGAYYTEAINAIQNQHRITSVPVNLSGTLITGWDIGIHDFTCIWVFQLVGKAVHFVDYIEDRGHKAGHYLNMLDQRAKSWGVPFKAHILPHDVEAREWVSGESRRFGLMDATPVPILTAERVSDADGVNAVRGLLGIAWFDEQRCRRGLARLRGYKKSRFGTPVHDDHSHGADAMKTCAVGLPLVTALSSSLSFGGRLRRRIRGLV